MPDPINEMESDCLNTEVLQLLSKRYTVIVSQATDGKFHIELFEDNPPVT